MDTVTEHAAPPPLPLFGDLPPPPRVPLRRRARRLLRRVVPFAVWCGALAAGLWFYVDQPGSNVALAFVEIAEVTAAPSLPGRITAVEVEVGQSVSAGDLIATLDTADLDARLRLAEARLLRTRTRIDAEREQLRLDAEDRRAQAASRRGRYEADGRRIREEIERLSADELIDHAKIDGLQPQIERLTPLVGGNLVEAERLEELVRSRVVLEARLASHAVLLGAARAEVTAWEKLAPAAPAEPDARAHLEPFELDLEVAEARVAALEVERQRHHVLAPADGVVHLLACGAGEWCDAGGPIAQIVVSRTDRMTAYVRGPQLVQVETGRRAAVRPRDRLGAALEGHVAVVAPRMGTMPAQLWRAPSVPEWGRRITIVLDDPADTLPGEVYDVVFR